MIFLSFSDPLEVMNRAFPSFLSAVLLTLISPPTQALDQALQQIPEGLIQVQKALEVLAAEKSCSAASIQAKNDPKDQPKPANPGGVIQCEKNKSPLFATEDVLDLTIQSDFSKLTQSPEQGLDDEALWKKSTPGKLTYGTEAGKKTLSIGLVNRAKSRDWSCKFKPLKVLLPEDKALEGTLFDPLKGNELKLVVHCGYREGAIEAFPKENEDVIKEYSAYKLLKAVGYPVPEARLLRVTYLKPDGSLQATGYGIFLEPKGSLGKRCACGHLKRNETKEPLAKMDPSMQLGFLFAQHLMAGVDWYLPNAHNAIPLQCNGRIEGFASYDFNDSGLVNAEGNFGLAIAKTGKDFFERIEKGPYDRNALGLYGIDGEEFVLSKDQKKVWSAALEAEVRRIYGQRGKLMTTLEAAPFKDKKLHQEHFDDFFAQLEIWAAKNKVDLK